eukprot:903475-Pleurochrysis_carterae.AAC.2
MGVLLDVLCFARKLSNATFVALSPLNSYRTGYKVSCPSTRLDQYDSITTCQKGYVADTLCI